VAGVAVTRSPMPQGWRARDRIAMAAPTRWSLRFASGSLTLEYLDTFGVVHLASTPDGGYSGPAGAGNAAISCREHFPDDLGYYVHWTHPVRGEVDRQLKIWEPDVAAHEYRMAAETCPQLSPAYHKINAFPRRSDLLQYRTFGTAFSFGGAVAFMAAKPV